MPPHDPGSDGVIDTQAHRSGLDLARDLAFDAGPCRRRQHDEPVEFLLSAGVGAPALLRRGPAVRRQPQQILGPRQSLLGFGGEVAAPPPNRLGFRDIERGNVLADGERAEIAPGTLHAASPNSMINIIPTDAIVRRFQRIFVRGDRYARFMIVILSYCLIFIARTYCELLARSLSAFL